MIIKNAFVYKNGKIIREDYDLSVGGDRLSFRF